MVPQGSRKNMACICAMDKMCCPKLAGEKIERVLDRALGNDTPFGGLKVITKSARFAARPSGTENVYRSMPRVSEARIIWDASWRRHGRWSTVLLA